jgi:hypothetical protein
MQGVTVISGGSGYPDSGRLSFSGCSTSPEGSFTAKNGVIQYVSLTTFGSGCDPVMFAVAAKGGKDASLRPSYGLTPSFNWSGNVDYCTTFQGHDMGASTCKALSQTMPAGDMWVNGATTALRMAAAGLTKVSVNDFHCIPTAQNSCAAGANVDELEADLGIVRRVSAGVSGTTMTLSYFAPDARACSVDISGDKGRSWKRRFDAGGTRERSLPFKGLSPDTSYSYRLLCYYDQSESWFGFPSDSSNLATSGTFTVGSASPVPAQSPQH